MLKAADIEIRSALLAHAPLKVCCWNVSGWRRPHSRGAPRRLRRGVCPRTKEFRSVTLALCAARTGYLSCSDLIAVRPLADTFDYVAYSTFAQRDLFCEPTALKSSLSWPGV